MFTKEQEEIMMSLYEKGSNARMISDAVNGAETTVKRWFSKKNLGFTHIKQVSKFDENQELILSLYRSGKNCNQIAREIGEDRRQLAKWLDRKGIDFSHIDKGAYAVRQYSFDKNFFKSIDSPEKAYVLGLFYSDGNVMKYSINITMTDLDIIEKVKAVMKYDGPILSKDCGDNKTQYIFKINSKELSQDIQSHGCTPNKSLILQWNDKISPSLMPHFIRGIFDGDGCISWHKHNKQYAISIVATQSVCNGLKQFFGFGFIDFKIQTKAAHVWRVWNKADVKTFLETIYKDATIYLDRKKEKSDLCLNSTPL